jgi:hypothetical protein
MLLTRTPVALDGVQTGRSGGSLPDVRALHLDPALARGPRKACMVDAERGWGELHGRCGCRAAIPQS